MTLSLAQVDWFAALLAVIGLVVWLVRLEGKVQINREMTALAQKSIDELRVRHEALDSELVKKLSKLETALARIEGYLKGSQED